MQQNENKRAETLEILVNRISELSNHDKLKVIAFIEEVIQNQNQSQNETQGD
jgi:hypothetical protein